MSSTPPQAAAISPLAVATRFIKQYYRVLSTNNASIHKFYKAVSQISFSPSCNSTASSNSFSDIESNAQEHFSWGKNSRVDFANGSIDAQEIYGGGILVVVTGDFFLDGKDEGKKLFVQTFILKEDGKNSPKRNFFVSNDVCRFLELENDPMPSGSNASVSLDPDISKEVRHEILENQHMEEVTKILIDDEANMSNKEVFEAEQVTPIEFKTEEIKSNSIIQHETVDSNIDPQSVLETGNGPTEAEIVADVSNSRSEEMLQDQMQSSDLKSKLPGSWASLVANSSSTNVPVSPETANGHTNPDPIQAPTSPPQQEQEQHQQQMQPLESMKKDSETSAANASNMDKSKRPLKSQEIEADITTTSNVTQRVSGYGSKGSSSLYIKNVGEGITEAQLRDLFSKHPFKIVNVSFYPSRGYAFVDFADPNAVNSIMKENRQTFEINGRTIEVEKKTSDRRRGGMSSGSASRGHHSSGGHNSGTGNRSQRQRSHSGRRMNGSDNDRRNKKGGRGGGGSRGNDKRKEAAAVSTVDSNNNV